MYSNLIYMCNTAHVFSNKNHLLQKKNSSLKKWLFAVDYVKILKLHFVHTWRHMKSEEMKLQRPFVNLGIATWELKLEMELQLELI